MTMLEIIRGICSFPQRGSCTESERQASQFVFDVMDAEGFQPRFFDFEVQPDFYKVYAAHLLLAVVCGMLAFACPLLALVGIAFITVSFYGDLTTRWYWLRRLFPKGSSRHVIGGFGPEDAARTLIFSGHHDAGQTAPFFEPEKLKRQTRFFKQKLHMTWAQYWPLMFGMALLFLFSLIRLAGGGGVVSLGLFTLGAITSTIGAVMHLTMWGKGFAGGANDNAAGVATAIETARQLRESLPPDTRIQVLSFGAEETMMAGSGTTVKRLFAQADKEGTYVINFEGTGGGSIRYAVGEGIIDVYPYDPELVAAARKAGPELGIATFTPFIIRSGGTDALPFVVYGMKAITLLGLDEDDYAPNYHWHTDLPDAIEEPILDQAVALALAMVRHLG